MTVISTFRSLVKTFARSNPYRIVAPGNVSAASDVPQSIPKPDYNLEKLQRLKKQTTINILSDDEMARMREAGGLASRVLRAAESCIKPGMTTDEIDKIVHSEVVKHGAYPSPLGYRGYPKSCCTSVNNVVCHGIPDDCALVSGDIINVDVTVYYKGCHGDTSDTFCVGEVDENADKLIATTRECLELAIGLCRPRAPFSSLADVIEDHARSRGFTICQHFVGHGIGPDFHSPPHVYHHRRMRPDRTEMKEGMAFTIEPILMEGGHQVVPLSDGWTVVSKDGGRSGQNEHTVLITKHGCDVLTQQ